MATLPKDFLLRMQAQLGAEYAAFLQSYERGPIRGLRVNTLKLSAEEFAALCPKRLAPVEDTEDGYRLEEAWDKVGSSPLHMAGLIYMQEPSAMLPISIADIRPGMKVLDMCAAPGGKTGAAAARLRGSGLIISNEIVPARAKILGSTIERMGIANAAVTCCRPDELAAALGGYFDRVIVDAPCSGEGMFRKDERAAAEWSLEHVAACAQRQRLILDSSAKCLAQGGLLIYSTCTFSPEENEMNIAAFLAEHKDFELIAQRKLLPHKFAGEGHFAAALRRISFPELAAAYAPLKLPLCKDKAYFDFIDDTFAVPPRGAAYNYNSAISIIPQDMPAALKPMLKHTAGVCAGEVQRGRFIPHHSLVMAEHGGQYKRKLCLDEADPRLAAYMHGEEIACPQEWRGYCAISCGKYNIGWGKAVNGRMKNHLPKGLRIF